MSENGKYKIKTTIRGRWKIERNHTNETIVCERESLYCLKKSECSKICVDLLFVKHDNKKV